MKALRYTSTNRIWFNTIKTRYSRMMYITYSMWPIFTRMSAVPVPVIISTIRVFDFLMAFAFLTSSVCTAYFLSKKTSQDLPEFPYILNV